MKKILLASLIAAAALAAQEGEIAKHKKPATQPYVPPEQPPPPPQPWFTGPLIAPIGNVVPWGDFEIESYIYFTTNTGSYTKDWKAVSKPNFFSLNPQWLTFWGITSWADIQVTPQFFAQWTEGQSSCHFGDLPIGFDFQLYPSTNPEWYPGIKFTVREIFPTGNYQHLNPAKQLTDMSGQGTFATNFNLLLYKIYHWQGVHYVTVTLSGSYTLNLPTEVHGFNTYGGGYGTKGKVLPGNITQGIFSFEIMLTQNWAFAMDTVWVHTDETLFYGTSGTTKTAAGSPAASVGGPSQEQLSFAPAIEYNFNGNFGIIVGAWVTATGRNSTEFRSGVINIDWTY